MPKKSNVHAALTEARKRELVCQSSLLKYGVPSSTLHTHLQKEDTHIGAGRSNILTPAEEREMEISCQVLQELRFGLTRETVGAIVIDYSSTIGCDNLFHGQPGPHWWRGFQAQHPNLPFVSLAGNPNICLNIGQLLATRQELRVSSPRSQTC